MDTLKREFMGAWGAGSFQNDGALDWLGALLESSDASCIRAALNCVVDHGGTKSSRPSWLEKLRGLREHIDWLTANDCSKAIAAAEVIAARFGREGLA